jgi:hypothetical protein
VTGYLWLAAYMVVVCAVSAAATGQLMPRAARSEQPDRGWSPGGEEDEPEPAPQPEQAVRVPSWARL